MTQKYIQNQEENQAQIENISINSVISDDRTTWDQLKDYLNARFFVRWSIDGAIPPSLGIRKGDIPPDEIQITNAFNNLLRHDLMIDEVNGYDPTTAVTLNLALKRMVTVEGVKTGTNPKQTDGLMLKLAKQEVKFEKEERENWETTQNTLGAANVQQ